MKKYSLKVLWQDGGSLRLTEPVAGLQKLEKARKKIAKIFNGDEVIIEAVS